MKRFLARHPRATERASIILTAIGFGALAAAQKITRITAQ